MVVSGAAGAAVVVLGARLDGGLLVPALAGAAVCLLVRLVVGVVQGVAVAAHRCGYLEIEESTRSWVSSSGCTGGLTSSILGV